MSLTLTLGALGLFAQPTGFGGFQMPKVDVHCSQKIADVDYAGDGQIYHKLDIYLPKVEKDTYPVVVHIYGSAWFSNNSKGMADLGTIVNALLDAATPWCARTTVPRWTPSSRPRSTTSRA